MSNSKLLFSIYQYCNRKKYIIFQCRIFNGYIGLQLFYNKIYQHTHFRIHVFMLFMSVKCQNYKQIKIKTSYLRGFPNDLFSLSIIYIIKFINHCYLFVYINYHMYETISISKIMNSLRNWVYKNIICYVNSYLRRFILNECLVDSHL